MTSIATRAVCALLSTMGAAGLVVFVDPATATPNAPAMARPAAVQAMAATTPVRPVARG